MHERVEPGISEVEFIQQLWKGLAQKTPWGQVMACHHHARDNCENELQRRVGHDRTQKRYDNWRRSQYRRTKEDKR